MISVNTMANVNIAPVEMAINLMCNGVIKTSSVRSTPPNKQQIEKTRLDRFHKVSSFNVALVLYPMKLLTLFLDK